jgi:hypothetical protein
MLVDRALLMVLSSKWLLLEVQGLADDGVMVIDEM